MSTLIIILIAAGFIYLALFHKPKHHTETELKQWFSVKLSEISTTLEEDIEKDKKGEYPHTGKQSFDKQGKITYVLFDKNYSRFDISDKNMLRSSDIMDTEGYKQLDTKTRKLKLSINLEEKAVEGDGVDTFNELDEYIDDFPRYYTVTIGNW